MIFLSIKYSNEKIDILGLKFGNIQIKLDSKE